MELQGNHRFNMPRNVVWEALMDPAVMAQALPGGEQLEPVGENEYKAAMNVRVGPVQGKFDGKVELSDVKPMESYNLKVNGQGSPGFVSGEGNLQLSDDGDTTLLEYSGELQIGGKIASVGQRLLDSTAKSMIRQGFKALDTQLQARMAPPPAAPAEVPPPSAAVGPEAAPPPEATPPVAPLPAPPKPSPTPSARQMATAVAKDVARDLASDYVPPDQQEKIFYALLGALGMLLFVILVRLVQKQ